MKKNTLYKDVKNEHGGRLNSDVAKLFYNFLEMLLDVSTSSANSI